MSHASLAPVDTLPPAADGGVAVPPTEGVVCSGIVVTLGWPDPAEFDAITALRNRTHVRTAFLDPRPLDPIANRAWLAHGMRRPEEALLAIRIGALLCGTIGWSGYDRDRRTFEIGRLIVDAASVLPLRPQLPPGYPGVAADASVALLRYAFERLGLATVTSVHLAERRLSRRVHALVDGRVVGESVEQRRDGSSVAVVRYEMTRAEWDARNRGAEER